MKYLVLLTLLTSCSIVPLEMDKKKDKKKLTYSENVRQCVGDLIGNHGIEAVKAKDVCESIYKRR